MTGNVEGLRLSAFVLLLGLIVTSGALSDPVQAPSDSATYRTRFAGVHYSERVLDAESRATWQLPAAVVDSLHLLPGQRVADIGAGTGYFNELLAKAVGPTGRVFPEEIEVDLVEHMRARAELEQTPEVVPVLGRPDDPCLPESLDLIFLCNTYRYIDGRRTYFANLRRNLSEGGRVAVVEFKRSPRDTTERRIMPARVVEEMESAGYELASEFGFLPKQFFFIFRVRDGGVGQKEN